MFENCVKVMMRAMQTVAMIDPYRYNVFKAWYEISVGKTINYLDPIPQSSITCLMLSTKISQIVP